MAEKNDMIMEKDDQLNNLIEKNNKYEEKILNDDKLYKLQSTKFNIDLLNIEDEKGK